jgi:hypothetical protein
MPEIKDSKTEVILAEGIISAFAAAIGEGYHPDTDLKDYTSQFSRGLINKLQIGHDWAFKVLERQASGRVYDVATRAVRFNRAELETIADGLTALYHRADTNDDRLKIKALSKKVAKAHGGDEVQE